MRRTVAALRGRGFRRYAACGKVQRPGDSLREFLMRTRPLVLVTACLPLWHLPALPARAAADAAAAMASATEAAHAEARRFEALVEEYFERYLELNPVLATSIGDRRYNDRFEVSISPQWRARSEALEREYLARLSTIDPARLAGEDALSYEIFRSAREREIEGYRFPSHLLPLNQFHSVPNAFAQMGAGGGLHPFASVDDYDDFLARIDGFEAWTTQAIANMREGMRTGYVLPRVLVERTLPQLRTHVVATPEESLYFGPVRAFPESFPAAERERLTAAWRKAIMEQIVPAYRRLHDFMRDEYLPEARSTVGLDALPDGKAWYEHNVRRITTTDYTPAQIHEIGLREVERIRGEMHGVMKQVGFGGTLDEFFVFLNTDPRFVHPSREALVQGYVDIRNRVDPQLPKLFEVLPKAGYEVRAVEPFREKSAAGGNYQAASEDGSRPGIFFANAYDLKARPKWAMEALSLHEGNPGHHFQITIQREQGDLPRFRRFGGYTAYSEGWALYAESLGTDLGVYTDPYQYFGRLEGELFRAIRLVVDTGLHSKGWTREQVLEYIAANSATSEARRVAETERYIAIPGQATAYKIGQLKISELRARAERELGERFDLRRFHTAVLADGALPLDVLEAKIERWIAAEKGGREP
jgi:uncharacterized protein (DUF885 family)